MILVITTIYDPNFLLLAQPFSLQILNFHLHAEHFDLMLNDNKTSNTPKYELIYSPIPFPWAISTSVNFTTTSQGTWVPQTMQGLFEVCDLPEIKFKHCISVNFILCFLRKDFRNLIRFFKEVIHSPKS